MNILFLISSEGYYGVENMIITLAQRLSQQGCHAVIGVFYNPDSPHTEVAEEAHRCGLPVEIVHCQGRWDWSAVSALRKLVVKHNLDFIHTHGYKADLYAYAAAWPNRVALLATSHNWTSDLLRMRLYAALDRIALRRFDAVVVVSGLVAKKLRSWGVAAKKISTIPNGVEIERFWGAKPILRGRCAPEGHSLVGFVGRLVPEKGGALLLRAAKKVLAVQSKVKFVLVGEGPAQKEWEKLAVELGLTEQVTFGGYCDDMPGLYASLDMVVLPSYIEALPMCLLESMAAGKPVIATRVGAVPELITNDQIGLLLDPGDEDGLAGAILRVLLDTELADRLGENGRAHVTRHFSAEAMAKSYLTKYRQVLERRQHSIHRQTTWEAN